MEMPWKGLESTDLRSLAQLAALELEQFKVHTNARKSVKSLREYVAFNAYSTKSKKYASMAHQSGDPRAFRKAFRISAHDPSFNQQMRELADELAAVTRDPALVPMEVLDRLIPYFQELANHARQTTYLVHP